MSDLRRDVRWLVSSARAFLRHFNPCNLAEDKSQQWQALSHQCDVVERALTAQAVEPVAYLHKNVWGDIRVSFKPATNPKWKSEPLYTTPPLATDERMRKALERVKSLCDVEDHPFTRLAGIFNLANETLCATYASNASAEAIELAYSLLWVVGCDRSTKNGNALYLARKAFYEQIDKAGQARGITAAKSALSRADATALEAKDKELAALRVENATLRDVLLHPDPDQEPDNVRLHREKCDAIDRAIAAEARAETAERERDTAITDGNDRIEDLYREIDALKRATPLFQQGDFMSAAGLPLTWKIECDALTNADWQTIALASINHLPPFRRAVGVPRGGIKLARALDKHSTTDANLTLVVDDVWTTGKSMREFAATHGGKHWVGFVAFARGPLPPNVTSFMQLFNTGVKK